MLCDLCRKSLVPFPPNRCYKCLQPSVTALCPTCQLKTELAQVWAATAYKDVSRQLIARIKFSRTQAAAYTIAQIMDRQLPIFSGCVVVHVPTAAQRIRQRGYDQAQLIAQEFAKLRKLPYQPLLRRQGRTKQLGATRQQRLAQLQNAYYCPRPFKVAGRTILLVDDVLTTGATVETAAKVLKEAGAAEVMAGLFAQKI